MSPKESEDGKQMDISLKVLMNKLLRNRPTYLESCLDWRLLISGDAAGLFRNLTHVNVTSTLLPLGVPTALVQRLTESTDGNERRLSDCFTVATYEGKDKHLDFSLATEKFLVPELTELVDNGVVVGDKVLNIKPILCGDLSMIVSCGAIVSCAAKCPCPFCIKPRAEFYIVGSKSPARTVRNTLEWAHLPHKDTTFPHTCSCCKKVFPTAESMSDEVLNNKAAVTKHHQTHYSVGHHIRILFEMIEVANRVFDILHFKLRGTDMLWEKGFKPLLVDEEGVAAALHWLKTNVHMYIRAKPKKQKKKADAKTEQKPNFIGRDCDKFLPLAHDLLRLMGNTDSALSKNTLKVLNLLHQCCCFLAERMAEDNETERKAKAAGATVLGHGLVAACQEAFSADDILLYVHIMADHAGDQVLAHGDLRDYACEKQEAIHAIRKRDTRKGNRRWGKKGLLYQSLKLEVVRNSITSTAYGRNKSKWAIEKANKKKKVAATLPLE